MIRPSRLSQKEIDKTLARIRDEYDHGIVHFGMPVSRKGGFEDRYLSALRVRTDMTLFLGVEVRVVQELVEEARREFSAPPKAPVQPKVSKSYADRVIEKLQARIKGYPSLDLGDHGQKSLDVEKLYGIFDWFAKNIWKDLYGVLIRKNPQPVLFALDDDVAYLTAQGRLPKALETYAALVCQTEPPLSLLAKAQNRCLVDGAHFVHRLRSAMGEVLSLADEKAWSRENPTSGEIAMVRKTCQLMDRILEDFRLKDLKPLS